MRKSVNEFTFKIINNENKYINAEIFKKLVLDSHITRDDAIKIAEKIYCNPNYFVSIEIVNIEVIHLERNIGK